MTEEEVTRWDEWFDLVGGEYLRQWEAAKSLPRAMWLRWASIIEMNRIDDELEKKNASV